MTLLIIINSSLLLLVLILLHRSATGQRCPDLQRPPNGHIAYYIHDDVVFANQTCDRGYVLVQTDIATKPSSTSSSATTSTDATSSQLRCINSHWNKAPYTCEGLKHLYALIITIMIITIILIIILVIIITMIIIVIAITQFCINQRHFSY